jgi:hypothetical protein
MTTTLPRARHACLAALLAVAACGGGSEAVLLIPLFEFGFTGKAPGDVGVQVFFLPDKPTTTTGTFDAVNMNVDGVAGQVHYTGTWSGCSFSLQTADAVQAPIAASYAGSFKGNDAIELKPTSGAGLPTLSLQRQGVGTKVTGC